MADFDVFNGDADGICALTQLRLAEPRQSNLITGVKRNISLLKTVTARPDDRITVLDISMDKNRPDLERLLAVGATVFYVDHHFSGTIPDTEKLTALINEAPDTCTSLLVNRYLENAFAAWAVVGAFGDNLNQQAQALADKAVQCRETDLRQLQKLGTYINYNGYGAAVEDLHIPPRSSFGEPVFIQTRWISSATTANTLINWRMATTAIWRRPQTLPPRKRQTPPRYSFCRTKPGPDGSAVSSVIN